MSVCKNRLLVAVSSCLMFQACAAMTGGSGGPEVAVVIDRSLERDIQKRPIGLSEGLPVYSLTGSSRAGMDISSTGASFQTASFNTQSPSRLLPGRFAFPDFTNQALSLRVEDALRHKFGNWIKFHGRGALSYTYEVSIPLSPGTKRDIVDVIRRVASEHTYAAPGFDGTWQPDYARIARSTDLKAKVPSFQSVGHGGDARARGSRRAGVQSIVSYVQSIPYGLPPNGYLYPDEVLKFNYGDCDSKSVLAAVLLRQFDPSLDYIFVDLPSVEHLIIGIDVEPAPGETSIMVGGRSYVLVEISGPAKAPLGVLSRSSRMALQEPRSHIILSSGRSLDL